VLACPTLLVCPRLTAAHWRQGDAMSVSERTVKGASSLQMKV
jgi:hypothetical protein